MNFEMFKIRTELSWTACRFLRLLLTCLVLLTIVQPTIQAQQVVVVVLDDSGSMSELIATSSGMVPRMEAAKSALNNVIAGLPEDTKLGVILLNGNGTDEQLITLGTLNRDESIAKINSLIADGATPLGQAMRKAADELLAYRKQHVYGVYKMLVITDGEATDAELLAMYLPMILSRGITIDVIGVGMQSDHQLASSSHSYRNVNDAESFQNAIQEILAESNFDQDTLEDFELLSGLPEELAAKSLEALAQVDNSPITRSQNDSQAAAAVSSVSSSNAYDVQIDGSSFLGTLCCCFPPVIVIILVIGIVISLINKQKRRR